MSDALVPFRVDVPDAVLEDLRDRLARTRWPDQPQDAGWSMGTDLGYMKQLVDHWQHRYDWRGAEARINAFPQVVTEIDGQRIHAFHVRSPEPDAPVSPSRWTGRPLSLE